MSVGPPSPVWLRIPQILVHRQRHPVAHHVQDHGAAGIAAVGIRAGDGDGAVHAGQRGGQLVGCADAFADCSLRLGSGARRVPGLGLERCHAIGWPASRRGGGGCSVRRPDLGPGVGRAAWHLPGRRAELASHLHGGSRERRDWFPRPDCPDADGSERRLGARQRDEWSQSHVQSTSAGRSWHHCVGLCRVVRALHPHFPDPAAGDERQPEHGQLVDAWRTSP